MKRFTLVTATLFSASALILSACQSEDGSLAVQANLSGAFGKIKVMAGAIHDPQDVIQSAKIRITSVMVRDTSGHFYTFQEAPFDLTLSNDSLIPEELMNRGRIPNGEYDHIRLITEELGSVTMSDGSVLPLRVPSGPQTGIKIFFDQPIAVVGGHMSKLHLKFDISRSFVLVADGSEMHFKPVVHADVEEIADNDPESGTDPEDGSGTVGDGGSTGGDTGSTGTGDGSDSGNGDGFPILIGT